MKYSIDYKFVLENMPAHTREPSLLELIEAGIERAKKERKGYEKLYRVSPEVEDFKVYAH